MFINLKKINAILDTDKVVVYIMEFEELLYKFFIEMNRWLFVFCKVLYKVESVLPTQLIDVKQLYVIKTFV